MKERIKKFEVKRIDLRLEHILIYLLLFVNYLICIYLFYSDIYMGFMMLKRLDISTFTVVYMALFLVFQPILMLRDFSEDFKNINYYSVLFGFILSFLIPFISYHNYFFMILILIIALFRIRFLKKVHIWSIMKDLSTLKIILVLLFSFIHFYTFSTVLIMGGNITMIIKSYTIPSV